jgi:hypothetical protein
LHLVSIPADTAEHLGWVRTTSPEELRAEADQVARQFLEPGDDDRKLWLIVGHGVTSNLRGVTETLDRELGDGREQSLRGSLFDEVVVYPHPGAARSIASPQPH